VVLVETGAGAGRTDSRSRLQIAVAHCTPKSDKTVSSNAAVKTTMAMQ
jgi:hypothetical protein